MRRKNFSILLFLPLISIFCSILAIPKPGLADTDFDRMLELAPVGTRASFGLNGLCRADAGESVCSFDIGFEKPKHLFINEVFLQVNDPGLSFDSQSFWLTDEFHNPIPGTFFEESCSIGFCTSRVSEINIVAHDVHFEWQFTGGSLEENERFVFSYSLTGEVGEWTPTSTSTPESISILSFIVLIFIMLSLYFPQTLRPSFLRISFSKYLKLLK